MQNRKIVFTQALPIAVIIELTFSALNGGGCIRDIRYRTCIAKHAEPNQTLRGPEALACTLAWISFRLMFEAVGNSAEVIAGVLGIAVTVVAIIVELAATRYNHRITDLFIREPLNLIVLSFFVATTLMCVWVAALSAPDGALWLHQVTMGMITVALLLLVPYFVYVLSFISPNNVIRRISRRAYREMVRCSKVYKRNRRSVVAGALEGLLDVMRSAIERGDRDIAIGCIEAMADLLHSYQTNVPPLPDAWYKVDTGIRQDPDFASLEPSALARIDENRTWFEYKLFSLFLKAMTLCSPRLQDAAYQIFIRTGQLVLEQKRNSQHFDLSLKTFNSYLRSTINSRDVKSAFFGFHQYREVAEALVERQWSAEVVSIAHRMQEYGLLAFQLRQTFLLEVCAHHLLQLLKKSVGSLDDAVDEILDALLKLDQDLRTERNQSHLVGVRRAQIGAAVAFLVAGDAERADRVITDLAGESQMNIDKLILQLEQEQSEEFWELISIGGNFLYLIPEERAQLDTVRHRLSALRLKRDTPLPSAS